MIDRIIDTCLAYFNDPKHDPEGSPLFEPLGHDYIHDHVIAADVTQPITLRRILIILFYVTDELGYFTAYATLDDDNLVHLALDVDTYIDVILDTTHPNSEATS